MTKLRGTTQTATSTYKPDQLIKTHKYDGPINRDYERLQKYSISYPGQVPYTVSSKKDLAQLKCIHKGATVKKV